MYTFIVHARVDQGTLRIEGPMAVPTGIPDGDHEIVIAIAGPPQAPPLTEWPEGFFDATYGSLADDPLDRSNQGVFEVREPLG